ncbi:MAG: NAD(P)/FAD-dependent oxidoreductase [Limnohabitans sp.]|nr:NAD(P)/FAD-dependent oxidoreductase [Limnohabitans sp.]
MPPSTASTSPQTDVAILGAGPAGLFQVFELGLLGITAQLVDVLPDPGGQCMALYADKPIYDIPGLPFCTGRELIERLMQQIKPFAPQFHGGHQIRKLLQDTNGLWQLSTDQGFQLKARCVVIAAGVGAFVQRRLQVPALDAWRDKQVFSEIPSSIQSQHIVVVGSHNEAIQACLDLTQRSHPPQSITLLHRREILDADSDLQQLFKSACDAQKIQFKLGQVTDVRVNPQRMTHLQIATPEGQVESLAVDLLIEKLGMSPKLGPIAQWGLAMDRKQLQVDTQTFATQSSGIFAIGDVIGYPGKKKLILSAFHEAALAAYGIAQYLHPDETIPFEYTTASARIHQRLGV